ncbi:fibroblast growth factor-binding protein 3 [Conger conger]|uniref:fibroblast growth factor-binding protein 3 n=1 Tax=Conger conger TaxID=82655 RepID=UPI002A5ABAEC|nr:fibroblast growth factor-binding protein 3 [Conger conger]
MRLLCALLFLLCLWGLQGTEGRKESAAEKQPARRDRNKVVPGSGELTSKENHRCLWETSGEGQVSLLISCSHGEQSYRCRYAGQPGLCPGYAARSSQYWKQLVGKLKKKRNACDGEKLLKTRVCKKAPAESHMRLVEEQEEVKKRGKGGGKKQEEESPGGEKEVQLVVQEKDAFGEVNDGNMETGPVESYCAEGWQSFCSFFVKFIDG